MSTVVMETVEKYLLQYPFRKIKYWKHPGKSGIQIQAYLFTELEELDFEHVAIGLAIDGSDSMKRNFGIGSKKPHRKERNLENNKVAQFAQKFCPQLAEKLAYDEEIAFIYWATGKKGIEFEDLGKLSVKQAKEEIHFRGPTKWGRGTHLKPALKHFIEEVYPDRRGFYLFISDGMIQDEDEVIKYCRDLAKKIAEGKHPEVRLYLVGVGNRVDKAQLERLDDMWKRSDKEDEKFPEIDLWDAAHRETIEQLDDLLIEWIDELQEKKQKEVAGYYYGKAGKIFKPDNNPINNIEGAEENGFLPALLEFWLPADATYFVLKIKDQKPITQRLFNNNQ